MAVATRIVMGKIRKPGTDDPAANVTVSAFLTVDSWVDDGTDDGVATTQILSTKPTNAFTNAAGVYTFTLDVNSGDAGIQNPTGTGYTLKVKGDPTILSIVVTPWEGGGEDPGLWVAPPPDGCLAVSPINPGPFVLGVFDITAPDDSIVVGGSAQHPTLSVNLDTGPVADRFGTYAQLDFLALDTDSVYFPAQSAGMVTDIDGTFYFSPGYAAVAKLVADTDGVAYPVAIGA